MRNARFARERRGGYGRFWSGEGWRWRHCRIRGSGRCWDWRRRIYCGNCGSCCRMGASLAGRTKCLLSLVRFGGDGRWFGWQNSRGCWVKCGGDITGLRRGVVARRCGVRFREHVERRQEKDLTQSSQSSDTESTEKRKASAYGVAICGFVALGRQGQREDVRDCRHGRRGDK